MGAAGACVVFSGALSAQAPVIPAGASQARAKELVAALAAKKLETFAAVDGSEPSRFVAVLHVPNVQLLLVSAVYERPTDIEYRLYHKDYQTAYADLRSSILSKKRVYVEDAFCDGLLAQPAKKAALFDTETVETEKHIFDGAFADPRKRNDTRITLDEYSKRFKEADDRYTRLLTLLLDELKK
jgi:hypothetical protein